MIDIHSHILPGIDDGARTMLDSLLMAQAAVQQGIHTIIATPHHRNGQYINIKQDIERSVLKLNESLEEANIPLTVLTGQETRLNLNIIEELGTGVIATLNNTKYVFVEFPSREVPRYAEQILFNIQAANYIPIIVHPERNRQIMEHPSILFNLVQKGALTQITAASLAGKFGKRLQKLSHQLVDANLTHFIASDAHNTTTRGLVMQEAFQVLHNQHGNEAFYTFMENARLLIDGQYVHREEPERVKKKIFGLF